MSGTRCCICEVRNSTFKFREGTQQERGICDFCLVNKFENTIDRFLVHVYGSKHGAFARIAVPELPKAVPEGEIRIALFAPSFKQSVPGAYRIIVSTPEVLAAEIYDVLVTP